MYYDSPLHESYKASKCNMCRPCKILRRKRFGDNDWLVKHQKYVQEWEARERVEQNNGAHYVTSDYREYLAWLQRFTRITVHPPISSIPIDEQESDDEDLYDVMTWTSVLPQRAPLENYMISISFHLCLHVDSLEKYVVMMIMNVL